MATFSDAKVTPVNTPNKSEQKTAGARMSDDVHDRLIALAERRTRALGRRFTKADLIACFIIDGLERETA